MREAMSNALIWLVAGQDYLQMEQARRRYMWEVEEIMRHTLESF